VLKFHIPANIQCPFVLGRFGKVVGWQFNFSRFVNNQCRLQGIQSQVKFVPLVVRQGKAFTGSRYPDIGNFVTRMKVRVKFHSTLSIRVGEEEDLLLTCHLFHEIELAYRMAYCGLWFEPDLFQKSTRPFHKIHTLFRGGHFDYIFSIQNSKHGIFHDLVIFTCIHK